MSVSSMLQTSLLLCLAAVALPAATQPPATDGALHHSLPAEPAAKLLRMLGTYGAPDASLIVYEDRGQLFADGAGLTQSSLTALAGRLTFEDAGGPHPQAAVLDGMRLPFCDVGAEVVETIRRGMRTDAAMLRAAALADHPPAEPAAKRKADLVALAQVDASFKFDIRYATTNNFMGFPLYDVPGAYLQRPAAQALHHVAVRLAPLGFGLMIFDGYRPWFVTKMFWDATPPGAHNFVADPAEGSRHNRGCAVDLTLYVLKTGRAVDMTGRYDEMSARSFAGFIGGTARQRGLRDLLRHAMQAEGFAVYPDEWWHFDFNAWHDYPIGNVTFGELGTVPRRAPHTPGTIRRSLIAPPSRAASAA